MSSTINPTTPSLNTKVTLHFASQMYRFQARSIVLISSSHDITLTTHDTHHYSHDILHSSRFNAIRCRLSISIIINRLD